MTLSIVACGGEKKEELSKDKHKRIFLLNKTFHCWCLKKSKDAPDVFQVQCVIALRKCSPFPPPSCDFFIFVVVVVFGHGLSFCAGECRRRRPPPSPFSCSAKRKSGLGPWRACPCACWLQQSDHQRECLSMTVSWQALNINVVLHVGLVCTHRAHSLRAHSFITNAHRHTLTDSGHTHTHNIAPLPGPLARAFHSAELDIT